MNRDAHVAASICPECESGVHVACRDEPGTSAECACTCGVIESGREANRPGDATNAPGHDTEEVTSMPDKPNAGLWYGRAERLLEEALEAIRGDRIDNMMGSASLAVACIHVVDGTQDASEFDGYSWPGEPEDESDCICPPDLREQGGFTSKCPVHGSRRRAW